jgi:hypothetical protein
MTDAPRSPDSEEPIGGEALEAMKNVSNQLTGAERLIAGGALLVLVVVWFLGTLLFDDYGLSNISVLIPIGLLTAMYLYYSGSERVWHPFYGTLLRTGAWAMAIIGVYGFIDDTLITSRRFDGATLFYELVFYAAAVMFAMGAWQLRGDDR